MLIRRNNFQVKTFGHKNDVIWNYKDSESIHVNLNHAELNQLIPYNSTNIGSINDSENIHAIEKMLLWSRKLKDTTAHASPKRTNTHALPVHLLHTPSPVPAPQSFYLWDSK